MAENDIPDDEIVYLRVPPGTPWFEPPRRVTTANFKIRSGEDGLSVDRASLRTPEESLQVPNAKPGSFIVAARVGDIRNLRKGNGDLLRLNVISDPQPDNPAHALIVGSFTSAASKALRDCFKRPSE